MMVFLFLLVFQDFTIPTIPPGNTVNVGSFRLEIPEGTLVVADEYLPHMFKVLGTKNIPHCKAMYIDNSDNWDYAISVQHLEKIALSFGPPIDFPGLKDAMRRFHIVGGFPVEQPGEFIIPPQIDEEERSFLVGLKYSLGDGFEEIVAKKIWAFEEEVLIETVRAKPETFTMFQEVIHVVFSSVSTEATHSDMQPSNDLTPVSYVKLLGLEMTPQTQAAPLNSTTATDTPQSFGLLTGVLLGIGVLMLVLAYKLKTENSETQTDISESKDSDGS